MRSFVISVALVITNVPLVAVAQDAHEYTVTALPRSPNAIYAAALIVDQRTGDVWEYIDEEQNGNTPSGVLIVYEGKVAPGVPGQVVARHGFGGPPLPER